MGRRCTFSIFVRLLCAASSTPLLTTIPSQTGGRDTAGLGGVGGYKRLWKGGEIKQVPDEMKKRVPDDIQEKAREMAREELKRRLEELDMSASEARGYGALLDATQTHMASLLDLLERASLVFQKGQPEN